MLNYNVMGMVKVLLEVGVCYLVLSLGVEGICVNVILVGLICILVVLGIKLFCKMLDVNEKILLFKCNVIIEDVGNVVLFFCLFWVNGIMGEIMYVDVGFNIVGMSLDLMFDD